MIRRWPKQRHRRRTPRRRLRRPPGRTAGPYELAQVQGVDVEELPEEKDLTAPVASTSDRSG
ncbi:hypothetical protein ACWD4G_16335 [Streptomyces sp. NPDC002643]